MGRLTGRRAYASPFVKASKAAVQDALADAGMTLVYEREHVGEWNERRVWYFQKADGSRIETYEATFKGDPVDWNHLMTMAAKQTGVDWQRPTN